MPNRSRYHFNLKPIKFLNKENKISNWLFKCKCGNFVELNKKLVMSGEIKNCSEKCSFSDENIIFHGSYKNFKFNPEQIYNKNKLR